MLLITCPWCGPREEVEFRYGGQAHLHYPTDPWSLDDAQWGEYLFIRDNPEGWFTERWCHTHGCRQWFALERHTRSYEFRPTVPGEAGRA